jgi:glucose-6-phosphate isomerase
LEIYDNIISITENKNSFLKNFIDKNKIKFFQHNPSIGGRFSVLSETGMLPFIDLPIKVEDASEKYLKLLDEHENDLSPVKNAAIILTCLQKYKLSMYCNLLYNYKLKHFSYWFHQLLAESVGKNQKGLTPITSICPKDHHSMMQLYIDGPKDKFFNIFSPRNDRFFEKFDTIGFENIEKYTPMELLNKQFNSVIEVFKEKQIPHKVINISDHNNPANIIELFSYFLLETIILGYLMGINPFDQPAVQLIKNKI